MRKFNHLCVFALLSPAIALGQDADLDTAGGTPDWRFELSMVLWASSVDSRVTIGPVTDDTSVSFRDVFEQTDAYGLAGRLEAWQGSCLCRREG